MRRPILSAAVLLASLFAGASAQAQIAGPGTLTPIWEAPYDPDVQRYGTPSGQVPNPTSRTQIFGFPAQGQTIQLQVVGARPGVDARFYVSSAYADVDVPGLGRQLVEPVGALMFSTTTDALGRASVNLPIPNSFAAGDEYFVQCETIDSAAPTPLREFSSAVYLEIGEVAEELHLASTLTGDVLIVDDGLSTQSSDAAGFLVQELRPGSAATEAGRLAFHVGVTDIVVNGEAIYDLLIQPTGFEQAIDWGTADFLEVAAGTTESFHVSYGHAGVDYGPYAITGTMSSLLGDVTLDLSAIGSADGGPLDGATISMDLVESFMEPQYFENPFSTALMAFDEPGGITPGDMDRLFERVDIMARAILERHPSFSPNGSYLPTYDEFIALESRHMLAATGGVAGTAAQLHSAISTNKLSLDTSVGVLLYTKLKAAFGISNFAAAFDEVLDDLCADQVNNVKKHIHLGQWNKARKAAIKLVKKIAGPEFLKQLGKKIGPKAAAKIGAKIGSKFVPIIGWALFIGSLIKAILEQEF